MTARPTVDELIARVRVEISAQGAEPSAENVCRFLAEMVLFIDHGTSRAFLRGRNPTQPPAARLNSVKSKAID